MDQAIFNIGIIVFTSTALGLVFAHVFTKDYLQKFDTDMLMALSTNSFLENQKNFFKDQMLSNYQLKNFYQKQAEISHDYFIEACHGLMSGDQEQQFLCELICSAKMDDTKNILQIEGSGEHYPRRIKEVH